MPDQQGDVEFEVEGQNTPSKPEARPRYVSLQIARALAAIAVLLVHVWGVTENIEGPTEKSIYSFGQAGVDLFFVISGFIISMIISSEDKASRFLARRAIRILPFYWAFSIIWLAMLHVSGKPIPSAGVIALSLAGAPMADSPLLGVGWSLEHEFIFYALAALLLTVRKPQWLAYVLTILAATAIVLNLLWPSFAAEFNDLHLLSLYHLQFLLGVVLYKLRFRIERLPALALIAIGASLFPLAAAMVTKLYGGPIPTQPHGIPGIARVVLFGAASVLVLAGLIALERQRPAFSASRTSRALEGLGDASYGLYLSHPLVIAVLSVFFLYAWPATLPPVIGVFLAIFLALTFSLFWFRWVEKPLLKRWEKR